MLINSKVSERYQVYCPDVTTEVERGDMTRFDGYMTSNWQATDEFTPYI